MDSDALLQKIKTALTELVIIDDQGLGFFESGSKRGFDTHVDLEPQSDSFEIDATDCLDEGEGPEVLIKNGMHSFRIEISKSKGGDPSRCFESGRIHCGSCDACGSVAAIFRVVLNRVDEKENKVTAVYEIEG